MQIALPRTISTPRWIYALHSIAALPVVAASSIFIIIAIIDLGRPQPFFTIAGTLTFLLLPVAAMTWLLTSFTRLIKSPTLTLTNEGLLYKTAFSHKNWKWEEIKDLCLVKGGRSGRNNIGVSFSWIEDKEKEMESRTIVLDMPFKGTLGSNGYEPLFELLLETQKNKAGAVTQQPILGRELINGIPKWPSF